LDFNIIFIIFVYYLITKSVIMFLVGIDRDQTLFFSSLNDFIMDDNPVRTIDYFVDLLIKENTNEFEYKGESGEGRPAFPFSVLLKLFIYGYIYRIRSSRNLSRECKRNIELIWLLRGLKPEYRTIAYFRINYKDIINKYNTFFKRKLVELKLTSNEFAIDGSKFKANASKDMLSREATLKLLKNLDETMQEYLESLEKIDKEEAPDEELSKEQLESKIEALESKIARCKATLSTMDSVGKDHISPTDIECSLMKSRDGYFPGYNAQFAAETKNHFVMAEYVTDSGNDIQELPLVVEELEKEISPDEIETLSDKGYPDLDLIEELETSGRATCYSALPEDKKDKDFKYDTERDVYICPQGKELHRFRIQESKNGRKNIRYKCKDCDGCPIRSKCTKSKTGRMYSRSINQDFRDSYRARMSEPESKKKIKKRGSVIEHIFGNVKVTGGKIPLLLRGKEKVRTEIKLYVMGYNMKRLITLFTLPELIELVSQVKEKEAEMSRNILFFCLFLHIYSKNQRYLKIYI